MFTSNSVCRAPSTEPRPTLAHNIGHEIRQRAIRYTPKRVHEDSQGGNLYRGGAEVPAIAIGLRVLVTPGATTYTWTSHITRSSCPLAKTMCECKCDSIQADALVPVACGSSRPSVCHIPPPSSSSSRRSFRLQQLTELQRRLRGQAAKTAEPFQTCRASDAGKARGGASRRTGIVSER